MMDNFEWDHGYSERFGMMWTNFSDPSRIGQIFYFHFETFLRKEVGQTALTLLKTNLQKEISSLVQTCRNHKYY